MLSSNSAKVFVVVFLAAMLSQACRFLPETENRATSPTPLSVKEFAADIPFSTKEPDNFQAEIVITTGGAKEKFFVARSGQNRRFDYNVGAKNQFSMVKTADDKNFLLDENKKIYAENPAGATAQAAADPFDFLTTEWLNQKTDAKFERLDAENNLTKYRVVLGEKGNSESIVWIDEKINLPVRQEFYSIGGEQRILNFTFELNDFKSPVNQGLFSIPPDFRKVPVEEFRRILQSED